jgi:hypothetical protein
MEIRKLKKTMLCVGAAWAATAGAGFAQAQQQQGHVSVRERPRPEYDAIGIHAGGFTIFPVIDASVLFTDNVFADSVGTQDDTIAILAPSVRAASNWNVHQLALTAGAVSRFYNNFDQQNSTDWNLSADGRLDVTRDVRLFGYAGDFDGVEPLYESPLTGLTQGIEYNDFTTRVGGEVALARTKFSANLQSDKYDYQDGRLFSGAVLDQDDRDRTVTYATGRVDYSVSPDTGLFVMSRFNWRDYDLSPPLVPINRNSDGYEVLAGVNLAVTRLISGEFGIGYMAQSYDQAGVSDENGLAMHGRLEWFPTELLTFTATANRAIGDAEVAGVASFVGTDASLSADYELLRNFIITGQSSWAKDEYTGLDRTENRWRGTIGADYMLNRVAAVYVRYDHWNNNSSGLFAGRDYKVNNISVGVRLRR